MEGLIVPFMFVPDGHPKPTEWLAEHPNAFKVRAKFVRSSGNADNRGAGLQFDLAEALERYASDLGDPDFLAEPLRQEPNAALSTSQSSGIPFSDRASAQFAPKAAVKTYLASQAALGQLALDPAPLGLHVAKSQRHGGADVSRGPNVTLASAPASAKTESK